MATKAALLSGEWRRLLPGVAAPVTHRLPVVSPGRSDSPWIHPPSGVVFSRGVERVQAIDCRRYDEDGHDVSVRYGIPGSLAVTAYVFPVRSADERDVAFFDSVRDMLGTLENAESGEESEVAFALGGHLLLRGRRVRAVGVVRGERRSGRTVAMVEMYVREPWAIKLRSTSTFRSGELAERFFEEWLVASRFGEAEPHG